MSFCWWLVSAKLIGISDPPLGFQLKTTSILRESCSNPKKKTVFAVMNGPKSIVGRPCNWQSWLVRSSKIPDITQSCHSRHARKKGWNWVMRETQCNAINLPGMVYSAHGDDLGMVHVCIPSPSHGCIWLHLISPHHPLTQIRTSATETTTSTAATTPARSAERCCYPDSLWQRGRAGEFLKLEVDPLVI